nr:MAG TPA: hypothetical protein [Caudoviricetes sp.]
MTGVSRPLLLFKYVDCAYQQLVHLLRACPFQKLCNVRNHFLLFSHPLSLQFILKRLFAY